MLRSYVCKLKGLNVQHSALITPPNIHIASALAVQNRKHTEKQKDKSSFHGMYDRI